MGFSLLIIQKLNRKCLNFLHNIELSSQVSCCSQLLASNTLKFFPLKYFSMVAMTTAHAFCYSYYSDRVASDFLSFQSEI